MSAGASGLRPGLHLPSFGLCQRCLQNVQHSLAVAAMHFCLLSVEGLGHMHFPICQHRITPLLCFAASFIVTQTPSCSLTLFCHRACSLPFAESEWSVVRTIPWMSIFPCACRCRNQCQYYSQ